jgi:transposase-like protein
MWARRPTRARRVILRCPSCRSDRVVLEGGLILGQLYRCLACDYVGALVLETDAPSEPPTGDG